jgi:hypothetical protein
LGVNQHETQSSIDAALTFAILWLDACRNSEDHRTLVEGVKLFLPPGSSALTCERLAHLHAGAAKWQLYEFDERHDEVSTMDYSDRGNIATHLVRCPNEASVLERFAESVQRVLTLQPESEVAVLLVASPVAPCAWRVPAVRIFSRPRTFVRRSPVVAGRPNASHSSVDGYGAAVHLSGDRLDPRRN